MDELVIACPRMGASCAECEPAAATRRFAGYLVQAGAIALRARRPASAPMARPRHLEPGVVRRPGKTVQGERPCDLRDCAMPSRSPRKISFPLVREHAEANQRIRPFRPVRAIRIAPFRSLRSTGLRKPFFGARYPCLFWCGIPSHPRIALRRSFGNVVPMRFALRRHAPRFRSRRLPAVRSP